MSVAAYRKVFVVGCPRSGTTWLRDVYAAHPDTVTSLESALLDFLRPPWWELVRRSVGAVAPASRPAWQERLFQAAEAVMVRRRPPRFEVWRPVLLNYFDQRLVYLLYNAGIRRPRSLWVRQRRPIAPYDLVVELICEVESNPDLAGLDHESKVAWILRRLFDRFFLAAGGSDGKLFVEKTPSHLFHARFLLRHFPEARIVEVVRDGRDVCVSMDAYKRWMPQDRKYQIWMWAQYVNEGQGLLADPAFAGRVLRLRYEDLKREREAEIARLLAFSGLESSPERVAAIVAATDMGRKKGAGEGKHYRKGAVGDWRERLSAEDQNLIRRMAGRELERLGYEGRRQPPGS